jgi:predicted Rossmann fold flavoprotein
MTESGFVNTDLLVVGGGAAGMMAAIGARQAVMDAAERFRIVMLERNPRPGAKIRISGGGKCNVTHEGSIDDLLRKGFPRREEQRFLKRALYAFSNDDLRELLLHHGISFVVRDDGKVFPRSGRADDVLAALESEVREAAVQVITGMRVKRVERLGEGFTVHTETSEFRAEKVVLATGGVSYRHTGTTGDGLSIARSLGHTVVPPTPALAPVFLRASRVAGFAGVALRDVGLVIRAGGKSVYRRGDLLFTHKGISGPVCLSLSRDAADLFRGAGESEAAVDFFPGQTPRQLHEEVMRYASAHGGQFVRTFLRQYASIPAAMVEPLLEQAGIDCEQKWANVKKNARLSLEQTLKRFHTGFVKAIPLDAGEVSAGGVALTEVNAATMESRLCKHLFFAGEILDYAGEVGGFNLQAAFSTGWLAGSHCYPAQE